MEHKIVSEADAFLIHSAVCHKRVTVTLLSSMHKYGILVMANDNKMTQQFVSHVVSRGDASQGFIMSKAQRHVMPLMYTTNNPCK